MVKNLPAVQETWVRSLGWEETLEKGMAIHSHGVTKSQTRLSDFHFHMLYLFVLRYFSNFFFDLFFELIIA